MKTVENYAAVGAFIFGPFFIPEHMREGLVAYVEQRVEPPGGFLTAVIENDLTGAIGRADAMNIEQLPAYVNFFFNHAPSPCWGSREKMTAWLAGSKEAA